MRTGVFFHEEFKGSNWDIIGDKFRNFPGVMEDELALEGVRLIRPEPVSEELLLRVHTWQYLAQVRKTWYFRGALLTVGGCVCAGELMAQGELRNALAFSVAAGHHAGPSSAWGGTYLSCSGPTIARIREMTDERRFAILDTDAHHGDGTRDIFRDDPDVLHVCFCTYASRDESGTKVDVNVGYRINDDEYLGMVREAFLDRVREFKPFMILHNLGHDTCQGDYGDRGLSRSFFPRLAEEVKGCADEVCGGRYLVITHGGFLAEVSEFVFPRVLRILAATEK
jgi:acetoin utilization deacetylase AcuC-like enzyme